MAEKKTYKRTTNATPINSDLGKLPPQALDIEEAVLGSVMLDKDAVITVMDIIKPESFYSEIHQKIFKAIINLSMNHRPIDILTVTDELRKTEELEIIGGPIFLAKLTSKVVSAVNVEYHARIIAQKYIQRELIRVSTEIQTKAYDDSNDVLDLLDFSENELFKVAEGNIKKETVKINVLLQKAIQQIEEAGLREDGLSGIPSGFTEIDRITSGWQKSDLVIIAARPSMGKTAFVLSMTRNMAVEHKKPIALFSLEMSNLQLVNRLIVSETELPHDKLKNGKLTKAEWSQLENRIKNLTEAPILIDDTPAISIFELRAKCRRLKMQHDIQMIIVDYLQLMTTGGNEKGMNREQEVSTISRSLKALAKELDIPVIALSQLNRSVESRAGDKRPQLSDLRESGAIEQDADMVLFIHRPERYGLTEDAEGNSLLGIAEIIIAKHRNGAVGDVRLRFRNELAKFCDLDKIGDLDDGGFNSVTYSSKMNAEPEFGTMPHNLGFDTEPPF